jgi:hypothetical protein
MFARLSILNQRELTPILDKTFLLQEFIGDGEFFDLNLLSHRLIYNASFRKARSLPTPYTVGIF